MGELGKIKQGFWEHEEAQMLTVPVEVFLVPSAKKMKVVSIYEDEGVLCIDVEEGKEEG